MISLDEFPSEASRINDYVLLRPHEVARIMRRSKEWVYDALRSGALPGRKVLGSWFVPKEDLILFMSGRLHHWPGS